MPTLLAFDEHVGALEQAGARLVAAAVDAGMDAPVPTCPSWTAAELLAHQTMVHRWATAHVRGDDPDEVPDQSEIRAVVTDLPGYFRDGLAGLAAALRAAPPDLAAMTFLNDAPPPRDFWARRQVHETTVHAVDALAARLGRVPRTVEADVAASLAVDGIDELLRGFFTRGRSKLYDGAEYAMTVAPTDADRRWIVRVGPSLTVEPGDGRSDDGDVTVRLTGTAAELYLGLWNRGDAIDVTGRPELIERWRSTQQVRWG